MNNLNKKPSFLERLTGALQEEENEAADNFEDETQEEEIAPPLKEPSPEAKASAAKPAAAAAKTKKITPLPEKNHQIEEDWLPESEGQLTIDVYQTPNEIVIRSTIAGVKPEDLDITITNDMVTIKGKREKDEEVQTEDYYYQECYWGAFSRSVILPVDVEADKATAGMKNGILTIRLPKIERIKTRKISISAS